jgi:hypothetical protein
VGCRQKGEGVRRGGQLQPAVPQVQQLEGPELQERPGSPQFALVAVGIPAGIRVRQDDQADQGQLVRIEDPVVVGGHAQGEKLVDLGLDLDMDQDVALLPIPTHHPDQGVGEASTSSGLAPQLPQFGVQELMAQAPVDVGMDVGEEEFQEGGEELMQSLLPGVVEVLSFLAGRSRLP